MDESFFTNAIEPHFHGLWADRSMMCGSAGGAGIVGFSICGWVALRFVRACADLVWCVAFPIHLDVQSAMVKSNKSGVGI
jgi:hypothetical protein